MLRVAPWVAAVACLVLSGPTVAIGGESQPGSWTQVGGNAAHASVAADVVSEPEVLRVFRLSPPDQELDVRGGMAAAQTRDGIVWMARDKSQPTHDCHLYRLDDPSRDAPELLATFYCEFAVRDSPDAPKQPWGEKVVGYDEARNRVLVCLSGEGPDAIFVSVDATTGAVEWQVRGADIGDVNPSSEEYQPYPWYCSGVSLDEQAQRAYVAFGKFSGRHRIASIGLGDGKVDWWRTVPDPNLIVPANTAPAQALSEQEQPDRYFWGVTRTTSGIVVIGYVIAPTRWAFATFTLDGTLTQSWTEPEPEPPGDPARGLQGAGSSVAAAQGKNAIFYLGGQLFRLDPGTTTYAVSPLAIPTGPPLSGAVGPGPAWWADHAIVPGIAGIADVDPLQGKSRWTWEPSERWQPSDVLIVPPQEAWVVAVRAASDTPSQRTSSLIRIGLDGVPRSELPLPFQEFDSLRSSDLTNDAAYQWPARMLPLADGNVLVFDARGEAVLLGSAPASERPRVEVDTLYPSVGQAVRLRSQHDPLTISSHLAWGDGLSESVTAGHEATHAYSEAGERTVRVTAVRADGTTRLSILVLHVGASVPRPATFLATAFGPEFQNLTFWTLGVALTSVGSATGFFQLRRKHRTLGQAMADVEEAHAAVRPDPKEARALLARHRHAARDLLLRRRITEAQHGVLEGRMDELEAAGVLESVDAPSSGITLSPPLERLRARILADDRVTNTERDAFVLAIANDPSLGDADKREILARVQARRRTR